MPDLGAVGVVCGVGGEATGRRVQATFRAVQQASRSVLTCLIRTWGGGHGLDHYWITDLVRRPLAPSIRPEFRPPELGIAASRCAWPARPGTAGETTRLGRGGVREWRGGPYARRGFWLALFSADLA